MMNTRDYDKRTARFTLYLYPQELQLLKSVAKENGIKLSDLIRQAINLWLERH